MILQCMAVATKPGRYIDLAGKDMCSFNCVLVCAEPVDPAGRLWSNLLILRQQTSRQKTWDSEKFYDPLTMEGFATGFLFLKTPWGAGCKDSCSKGDTSYQCTMEVFPRPSQNYTALLACRLNPTGRITETCCAGQVELGTHDHRCHLLSNISVPLQVGDGSSFFER